MKSEDKDSVRVWLSAAPDEPPVLDRSLNVAALIKPTDSTIGDVKEKIRDICDKWYANVLNFEAYRQLALKWKTDIVCKGLAVPIRMCVFDAHKTVWEFRWRMKWHKKPLRFTTALMAIDWLCAEGLTRAAKLDIRSWIRKDIESREAQKSPIERHRRKLLERLMKPLPKYRDLASEVTQALFSPRSLQRSVIGIVHIP